MNVPHIAWTVRYRAFVLSLLVIALLAACSDGKGSRKSVSPTSPTPVASADGDVPGGNGDAGPVPGIRNLPGAVEFAPRNETFNFRQQLETTYRDQLRRSATSSFVDIEGTIVWTQEYLRYRVNGCGHQDAINRVQSQISGQGIAPVCADFTGANVQFPPRNEPFAFRQELERIYRDQLRRSTVQTFVDAEGDIVWTQEYLRYRVNGCSHTEALNRTLSQVTGGPVQPTCTTVVPPPPPPPTTDVPPVTTFVTGVSGGGATGTLVRGRRPDAREGPVVTPSSNTGSQVTLTASSPIDHIVVSVETNVSGVTRIGTAAVADSYFDLRLPAPTTSVTLNIQMPPGGTGAFTLEFAGALGDGPFGPYRPQPVQGTLNLTGRWVGTDQNEFGTQNLVFQLTQSGSRITGVVTSPDFPGTSVPFEGTLTGSTLTFESRTALGVPECSDSVVTGSLQVTSTTMVGTYRGTLTCFGESFSAEGRVNMTRQ